jgi:hypothetical protein
MPTNMLMSNCPIRNLLGSLFPFRKVRIVRVINSFFLFFFWQNLDMLIWAGHKPCTDVALSVDSGASDEGSCRQREQVFFFFFWFVPFVQITNCLKFDLAYAWLWCSCVEWHAGAVLPPPDVSTWAASLAGCALARQRPLSRLVW